MSLTLKLSDEQATALQAKAAAEGLSLDQWIQKLAEPDSLSAIEAEDVPKPEPASGMVEENGLLVYRTGKPLPAHVIDDAIRRSREDRSLQLLGNLP